MKRKRLKFVNLFENEQFIKKQLIVGKKIIFVLGFEPHNLNQIFNFIV